MATALSNVDVCNMAFDLLRHKDKVVSLATPTSDSEVLAARWYDPTRRFVLGNFPFNFARQRVILPLSSDTVLFGYANGYNLPNDFLALVFIGENYNSFYEVDYSIEGNKILIDNDGGSTLEICYVKDFTEVAKFDPLFLNLLVCELGIVFAPSITGGNQRMKDLRDWKKELELKARAKNGHDNPPKRREVSKLITARRRGMSNGITDGVHLFTS